MDDFDSYLAEGYVTDPDYGGSVVTEMRSSGIGRAPARRPLGDVSPVQACQLRVLQLMSWAALARYAQEDALAFSQSLGAIATVYGRVRASLAALDPAFPPAIDGYWSERTRNVVRSLLAAAFGTARRAGYDAAAGLPASAAELPAYVRDRLVAQVPPGSALTDYVSVVERAPPGSIATWLERAATEDLAAGCGGSPPPSVPETSSGSSGSGSSGTVPVFTRLLPRGSYRFVTTTAETGADDGGTPPPPPTTPPPASGTPPRNQGTSRGGNTGMLLIGGVAIAAAIWWLIQDANNPPALRDLELDDDA